MHKKVLLTVPEGQEEMVLNIISEIADDDKADFRSKLVSILDLLSNTEDFSEASMEEGEEEELPLGADRLWAASRNPMDNDPMFGGSGASIRHEVAEARLDRRNSIKKLSSASAKSGKIRTRARKNLFSTLLNSIKSQ